MSELRDLTQALKAFNKRLTSIEDCLLSLVRDSRQQSEWRHHQKSRTMIENGFMEEQERAMLQVQEACGAISHRLTEVVERLDNQAAVRLDDVKELRQRIADIEKESGNQEVTKA